MDAADFALLIPNGNHLDLSLSEGQVAPLSRLLFVENQNTT